MLPAHERVVRAYLTAKDHGLPAMWPQVFAEDATFTPSFDFDAGDMPTGPSRGLPAIAKTFAGAVAWADEILTVVPAASVVDGPGWQTSDWVVGMHARSGEGGFVGWGSYRWAFDDAGGVATALEVRFVQRVLLSPAAVAPVMDWLRQQDSPWCDGAELKRTLPGLPELAGVGGLLERAW